MNATFKKTLFAAAMCLPALGATAEINVDFETPESYKGIGVWDAWEHSPFRLGELSGNYAVTANPDRNVSEITGMIPNDSEMVLGAQRSRFGSNRFGVKVDLPETFELTPQIKYVHVMLYKTETKGRVMLMGLGSRQERKGQDPYTLQFSTLSSNAIEPGRWFDAVFAVKGAGGIDIRSLVIVPDCESPHTRTSDFLFYVDNIVVDNSPVARVNNEYYPVFGSKGTAMTRTDRGAKGIYLICDGDTTHYIHDQNASKKLYADLTSKTFYAKAGQTLTPGIDYSGTWMHSYCYVDFGNDGNFNTTNELVAYNHYEGKNSAGESSAANQGNNVGKMPSFTIPADTKPGMYRIRFKVDWNSIDPAGNPGDAEGKNTITSNGGAIFDAMLCVYGNKVTVNDFQLNGEVLAANGDKLNAYQVDADKPFAIKSAPEKGFHNGGVNLNFGFNLNDEPTDKYGNPQYVTIFVPASDFNEDEVYTIPASMMRGDLLINGNMVEDGPAGPCSEGYFLNFPEDLKIQRDDRKLNSIALATPEGTVTINIPAADCKSVYQNMLSVEVPVMAGETVTPTVSYNGTAMHTYWYVDLNEDGSFSTDLNADGTPAGEMLSYSHFNGKNSLGNPIDGKPGQISPALNHPFVIPAETPEGLYRCRFKIDWSNVNPGGNYGNGSNDINDNGGYVVDFLLHVHGATATVTSKSKLTVNGQGLPYSAPRKQDITVAGTTADGNNVNRITARYGYHQESARSTRYSHVYWREIELTANADGTYTVPADITDRPVMLITDDSSSIADVELISSEADSTYDLQGRKVAKPTRGIYILNGRKVSVR